jgi:hypothetical protein
MSVVFCPCGRQLDDSHVFSGGVELCTACATRMHVLEQCEAAAAKARAECQSEIAAITAERDAFALRLARLSLRTGP